MKSDTDRAYVTKIDNTLYRIGLLLEIGDLKKNCFGIRDVILLNKEYRLFLLIKLN